MCGLKNTTREVHSEEENIETKPIDTVGLSDLSEDNNSNHSMPVAAVSKVSRVKHNPTKRRKIDKPLVLPANDIRLTYGEEYLRAINSSDASAYEAMLRKIAIPKVVMVSRKNIPDPDHLVPTHMEVNNDCIVIFVLMFINRLLGLMQSYKLLDISLLPFLT